MSYQSSSHLCTADFARMKGHRQRWESAVAEWKDLICKVTLNQFISFMESSEVVSPPELERQKELLATEQAAVNRRREDLLRQMAGFRPPITTKSAVYQWKENVEKLNQQLGTCRYMHNIHDIHVKELLITWALILNLYCIYF